MEKVFFVESVLTVEPVRSVKLLMPQTSLGNLRPSSNYVSIEANGHVQCCNARWIAATWLGMGCSLFHRLEVIAEKNREAKIIPSSWNVLND